MKIGILTHYDVNNLGAQLQMYALYNSLEKLGHIPKILTYNKNFDFKAEDGIKNQVSIRSVPYYLKNYLLDKGLGLTLHNVRKYRVNKDYRLSTFRHENYATADIDMAVVGSDEVFSLESGVNMMMYGHAVNTTNMISYAPSFGQTDMKKIEKFNCTDLIASGLSKFKALSVRDEHTATTVEELTGIRATLVCDPVMLYDFSNTHVEMRLPRNKYMVVYSYDRNMNKSNEISAIKSYAQKNNLTLVSPGTYHKWCDINVVCNCLEWVEIFRGAEAVITDTFHGTIVSAITNVPMAVYVRDKINRNKLCDLLLRLKINDRQLDEVSEQNIDKIFSNQIDFSLINKRVKEFRQSSHDYLIRAIECCKRDDQI